MKERIIKVINQINPGFLQSDSMKLEIDSHDIFNIIVQLEEEFEIEIDPTMLKAENFETVDALEAMIAGILLE